MGMILRIASSRIVGQGDIVGRSGYFSLNLSANSVMRGRLDARRTLKSLVADLRDKNFYFKNWSLGLYIDLQNVTMSKLRQPDVPVSTGIIENPYDPIEQQKYKMKYIKLDSGTLVPSIGVTVQF